MTFRSGPFSNLAPAAAAVALAITPVLVDSFITNANPAGVGGDSGNAFQVYLPNKVGAGDLLGLAVSYPSGRTVSSISDNVNGAWSTTPVKSVSDAQTLAVFLFPNSAASSGQCIITFTMDAAAQPVKLRFIHFMNIATSSPQNGTAGQSGQVNSGSGVNAGSLTPGANALGNLILLFADCDASNASGNPTSWSVGGGFTLHDADIGWVSNQGYPAASAYLYQATPSAITPTITPNGDTATAYNCVAVALKVAAAGVAPAAFRVVKVNEHSCNSTPAGTWKLQMPTVGNLRVATIPATATSGSENISGVTDSESNTWTNQTPANQGTQMFWLGNAAANPNLVVDVALSSSPGGTMFLTYDVIGAAASPLGATGTSPLTTTSGTSQADAPDITPTQVGSLVITCLNNLLGPTTAITAPSGAFWDGVNYTGKSDASQMDWGNGWGHLYTASLAAESWTWTFAPNGAEVAGLSAEFKHP